jgi:spermidine synthase
VDGTYASSWEPGSAATGSVWDAIACGVLALPAARRRRVLLLGLGGGSAARIVRAIAPRARITGVEIDPDVVKLARRWFDLDALGVETVVADAVEYIARTRAHYDVVLEDCFIGSETELRKPVGIPEPAFSRIARRLRPGGVLVSNALDEAPEIGASLRGQFPSVVRIGIEGYDNRVFAAGPAALGARSLRAAVARDPVLSPTLPILSFQTLRRRQVRIE